MPGNEVLLRALFPLRHAAACNGARLLAAIAKTGREITSSGVRHGAASRLERLSEAFARHLRGRAFQRHDAERKSLLPHRSTARPATRSGGNISIRRPASRSTEKDEVKGYEIGEGRVPAGRGGGDRGGADRILAHAGLDTFRRQDPRSSRSISTSPIISRRPTRSRRRPSRSSARRWSARRWRGSPASCSIGASVRCMIEPFGKGMLLTTLRYDNTVRKAEDSL